MEKEQIKKLKKILKEIQEDDFYTKDFCIMKTFKFNYKNNDYKAEIHYNKRFGTEYILKLNLNNIFEHEYLFNSIEELFKFIIEFNEKEKDLFMYYY